MQGVVQYDISPVRGPLANAFVLLINMLFFKIKLIGLLDVYPMDKSQALLNEEETTFDFIIVGSGAAGCVVANQISANPEWSVLLLEVGDYPSPTTEVPGLYLTLLNSEEDWRFVTEPDPNACQAFTGGKCTILGNGKVLGGTSTINNMIYTRDIHLDKFDASGFESWNSNVTRMIFHLLEGYTDVDSEANEKEPHDFMGYGTTGPLRLHTSNISTPLKETLMHVYRVTGYTRMPRRQYIGFTERPVLIHNSERVNVAKAFLTPIKQRPNFFFSKKSEVRAVGVTEPIDKRANGVNVTIDGNDMFLRARKEVILTAGAINNAKILLKSGIGPKNYLDERKIRLNADLKGVGKNLRIRLVLPVFASMIDTGMYPRNIHESMDLMKDTFEYITLRKGNFAHVAIENFVNYIRSTPIACGSYPDLAIEHVEFNINDRNLMAWSESYGYTLNPKVMNKLLTVNKEHSIVMFNLMLLEPKSSGEVLLNNTHYDSNPIIKGNFMSDRENKDYSAFFNGLLYLYNLTQVVSEKTSTNYFSKFEFLDLDIPNCRNYKFCSNKYLECYIHNMAYPIGDVSGTAKMGLLCEQDAVVKEDLEVKHVRCLRVGDSSVLPSLGMGHTLAEDAMVGYKLSEILKEKWLKGYEHEPPEQQEIKKMKVYRDD